MIWRRIIDTNIIVSAALSLTDSITPCFPRDYGSARSFCSEHSYRMQLDHRPHMSQPAKYVNPSISRISTALSSSAVFSHITDEQGNGYLSNGLARAAAIWGAISGVLWTMARSRASQSACIALMAKLFDRPAFYTPIRAESDLGDFKQAITDTIQARGTGMKDSRNQRGDSGLFGNHAKEIRVGVAE